MSPARYTVYIRIYLSDFFKVLKNLWRTPLYGTRYSGGAAGRAAIIFLIINFPNLLNHNSTLVLLATVKSHTTEGGDREEKIH